MIQMLRLLIVDDEQPILDGLKHLIDWSEFGIGSIETAKNGRDALSVMKTFKPDIIITDIKMPFMNGLELIRRVKEELPGTKCIVLSGYQDFEYVRQAMKYEAVRYLLKPVEEDELIEILQDIRESVIISNREKERLENLNRKLLESESFLRNKLLYDIVSGEITDFGDALDKLGRAGIQRFPKKYVCAVLEFEIAERAGGFTENDWELVRFAAANIADELINAKTYGQVFYMHRKQIIMVVEVSCISSHMLVNVLGDIIRQVSRHLNMLASIGVSNMHTRIEDAAESFREAVSALRYKLLTGWGKVIIYNDIAGDTLRVSIPGNIWKRLENSVITGDCDNIPGVIAEIFGLIRTLKGADPTGILEELRNELLIIRRNIEGIGLDDTLLKNFINDFDQKKYALTLKEIEDQFTDVFQRLAKDLFRTGNPGAKTLINQVKQYIDQNYADDITLNTLSEIFYLNSSYMSRLFKQELGENFIDYLTGKRMEEAMKLLLNTRMTVYEISERIGYGNPKYFSQLFKKHTGRSPREFRERK